MDLEKIVALGCQLGLSGAELRKWVAQKEKEENEKTERARQAAREEAERAEKEREKEFQRQLQLEREKAKLEEKARQAEAERERAKAELEEKARQAEAERERAKAEREEKARKAELEILKRRLEIQGLKVESSSDEENAREGYSDLSANPETIKERQDISRSEEAEVSAIRKEEIPPDMCESAPLPTWNWKVDDPTGDAELQDGDNIPVVDVITTSGPNPLDEGVPDIAGRVPEKTVVFPKDTGNCTLIVQEDPVRDCELSGQTSAACVTDSSRSKETDSIETPVRSGAALRGGNAPYISVGDDPVTSAVGEKPPAVSNEEPRFDASDRGEAVPVATRAPAKAKPAHFRRPKSAAPAMEPHRRKRSAEGRGKNKRLKTGLQKLGKQPGCRNKEFRFGLKSKRKHLYCHLSRRTGGKKRQSVISHSVVHQVKAQAVKHFFGPSIAADTIDFVASCDIWIGTSPKRRIPQAQSRKRPMDTG